MELRRALVLSGAGHGALALWAVVAAWTSAPFSQAPVVTEVSLISGAEFAALAERAGAGAPGAAAPPPRPAVVPEAVPEAAPEAASPATDLADVPGDTAVLAPRVAPRAALPPDPAARPAPAERTAAEPVPAAEATETPERVAAAAPEAATTRIVTEATREGGAQAIALAPVVAPRPRARPSIAPPAEAPPAPVAQPEPQPEPETALAPDLLAGAIAGALGESGGGAETGDPGPPLTLGERDALRLAVQSCWVVDVGSEAASVVVTVAMSMGRDGRVVDGSLRQVAAEGGGPAAQTAAFQAARRAILRCQGEGYDLPPEKYERWREIEMVFNPAEMRLR